MLVAHVAGVMFAMDICTNPAIFHRISARCEWGSYNEHHVNRYDANGGPNRNESLISSKTLSDSVSSETSRLFKFASTCSTRVAPTMIVDTHGRCLSHARDKALAVVPNSSANADTFPLSSSRCSSKRFAKSGFVSARDPVGIASALYLPVKMPPASGK